MCLQYPQAPNYLPRFLQVSPFLYLSPSILAVLRYQVPTTIGSWPTLFRSLGGPAQTFSTLDPLFVRSFRALLKCNGMESPHSTLFPYFSCHHPGPIYLLHGDVRLYKKDSALFCTCCAGPVPSWLLDKISE
jgi:hypothetical protein